MAEDGSVCLASDLRPPAQRRVAALLCVCVCVCVCVGGRGGKLR